jgi:branched-subunit amino acid ABC-type transport system permease component
VETAAKYLVPSLSSILFFATMLAVLAWRPAGLFGRAH